MKSFYLQHKWCFKLLLANIYLQIGNKKINKQIKLLEETLLLK